MSKLKLLLQDLIFKMTSGYICPRLPRKYLKAVTGFEHLPRSGPYIIVANHLSFFDHLLLGAMYVTLFKEKIYFLTKKESFTSFWSRLWHDATGAIPIDREGPNKSQFKTIIDLIKQKCIVVIYPEGTRSKDGTLLPFKTGAFKIAARMKVPIIPIGIIGSNTVLPIGSKWFKPGSVRLAIGPALDQQRVVDKDIDGLMLQARGAIESLVHAEASPVFDQTQCSVAARQVAELANAELDALLMDGTDRANRHLLNKVAQMLEYARLCDSQCLDAKVLKARIDGLKALQLVLPFNLCYVPSLRRACVDILSNDPNHPYGHYIQGTLYLNLPRLLGGSFPKALLHLEAAYQRAGDYALMRSRFGVSYAKALFKSNRRDDALNVLNTVRLESDRPDVRHQKRLQKVQALIGEV